MMTLELGCGVHPTPGAVHHDRVLHSPNVDIAHDLDCLPWPWADGEFDKILALDVMEHLRLDVADWLDECHRILKPGGKLVLRLPAWDNPVSYRDPTHRKVFHPETFDYWDKSKQLHADYGFFYFGERGRWWDVLTVERVNGGDFGFVLRKVSE
jgi:predicted SAM-dependent methyltransferase